MSADDKLPQRWVRRHLDYVIGELTTFILDCGITDLVRVTPPGMLPSPRNDPLARFADEVAPR